MIIYSTRMGDIEIQESDIIRFSRGLPGFAEEKAFIMFCYQSEIPFFLLQSVITPELTFVIADPFEFFKDYQFKLDDETINELELNQENLPETYVILTVPEEIKNMTANLAAPIVINRKKMIATQVILEKSSYTTRHRIFPLQPVGKTCGKERE